MNGGGLSSSATSESRRPGSPVGFRCTRWTSRLPLKTEATIAVQALGPIKDVAQLEDKTAEITPPHYVPRVSSSSVQISVLTVRTEELGK